MLANNQSTDETHAKGTEELKYVAKTMWVGDEKCSQGRFLELQTLLSFLFYLLGLWCLTTLNHRFYMGKLPW